MSRSGRRPSWCPPGIVSDSPCAERITNIKERAVGGLRASKMSSQAAALFFTTTRATDRRRFSQGRQPCTPVPTTLPISCCPSSRLNQQHISTSQTYLNFPNDKRIGKDCISRKERQERFGQERGVGRPLRA